MSAKKDNTEYVPKSEFSIVRKIVSFFKLGEEGKMESFFAKLRKALKRELETLDKRVDLLTFNHKRALEDLDESIEDATSAREDAFLQVDVNDISTNQDVDSFMPKYWRNIELAEANLKTLTEKREKMIEDYNDALKSEKEQIAERKRRMVMISAKEA